jgi:hypothetical protein
VYVDTTKRFAFGMAAAAFRDSTTGGQTTQDPKSNLQQPKSNLQQPISNLLLAGYADSRDTRKSVFLKRFSFGYMRTIVRVLGFGFMVLSLGF